MKGIEPIRGFDFHCHVDLYPDPTRVIAACERKGIVTLAVTTTPKAWLQNRRWTRGSRYVFPALGLHPELVGERHHEIALLEEHMKESHLIGEIGLDGSRQYQKSWQAQVEVFTRALAAAQHLGGRVLSIHSRRAGKQGGGISKGVHDCGPRLADFALVLGIYNRWPQGSEYRLLLLNQPAYA